MSATEKNQPIRVSKLFMTPVITYRVSEPNELNNGLKCVILDKVNQLPSTRRSNVGGWRSEPDFLEWPFAEVKQFNDEIQKALSQVISTTTSGVGFEGFMKINAWVNLLGKGHYNSVHNHPESAWSGVYYVDAGTKDPANPLSGILELLDPRPFVEMVAIPGTPFGRPARIEAENGLMVFFPSWLYHHVHAYTGTDERIAIAFNVSMTSATTRTAMAVD